MKNHVILLQLDRSAICDDKKGKKTYEVRDQPFSYPIGGDY